MFKEGVTKYLTEIPKSAGQALWRRELPVGETVVAKGYYAASSDTSSEPGGQRLMLVELNPELPNEDQQRIAAEYAAQEVVVVTPQEFEVTPIDNSYVSALLMIARQPDMQPEVYTD